jgi:hypothetical protein
MVENNHKVQQDNKSTVTDAGNADIPKRVNNVFVPSKSTEQTSNPDQPLYI